MSPSFVKLGRRHIAVWQDEKGIYTQTIFPVLGAVIFLTYESWMGLISTIIK
jgi:hypothetical protein